jgi:hypothetical protein
MGQDRRIFSTASGNNDFVAWGEQMIICYCVMYLSLEGMVKARLAEILASFWALDVISIFTGVLGESCGEIRFHLCANNAVARRGRGKRLNTPKSHQENVIHSAPLYLSQYKIYVSKNPPNQT